MSYRKGPKPSAENPNLPLINLGGRGLTQSQNTNPYQSRLDHGFDVENDRRNTTVALASARRSGHMISEPGPLTPVPVPAQPSFSTRDNFHQIGPRNPGFKDLLTAARVRQDQIANRPITHQQQTHTTLDPSPYPVVYDSYANLPPGYYPAWIEQPQLPTPNSATQNSNHGQLVQPEPTLAPAIDLAPLINYPNQQNVPKPETNGADNEVEQITKPATRRGGWDRKMNGISYRTDQWGRRTMKHREVQNLTPSRRGIPEFEPAFAQADPYHGRNEYFKIATDLEHLEQKDGKLKVALSMQFSAAIGNSNSAEDGDGGEYLDWDMRETYNEIDVDFNTSTAPPEPTEGTADSTEGNADLTGRNADLTGRNDRIEIASSEI